MKIFTINENDEDQRLNKFIEKAFLNVPTSLIYKFIRKKRIKVNKKISLAKTILKKGDVVTVFGLDDFLKERTEKTDILKNRNLKFNIKNTIVFEDENVLVLNKKKGMLSHPNSKQKNSLINYVIEYLTLSGAYNVQKEKTFTPAFCTRLDRNTKGLIIVGKNAKALRALNELTKNKGIEKTYYCKVEGVLKKRSDVLIGYWNKNNQKNKVVIKPNFFENSKKVTTKYLVVKQFKESAILKIIINSGRSHQIRAHLKQIGNPIIGDFKYGSKFKNGFNLICCGLKFNSKGSYLNYLNGKNIILKNFKL